MRYPGGAKARFCMRSSFGFSSMRGTPRASGAAAACAAVIAAALIAGCGGSDNNDQSSGSMGGGGLGGNGSGGDLFGGGGTGPGPGVSVPPDSAFIQADIGAYALGEAIGAQGVGDTGVTNGGDGCNTLVGAVRDFKG